MNSKENRGGGNRNEKPEMGTPNKRGDPSEQGNKQSDVERSGGGQLGDQAGRATREPDRGGSQQSGQGGALQSGGQSQGGRQSRNDKPGSGE